jgi:hypothetical protein
VIGGEEDVGRRPGLDLPDEVGRGAERKADRSPALRFERLARLLQWTRSGWRPAKTRRPASGGAAVAGAASTGGEQRKEEWFWLSTSHAPITMTSVALIKAMAGFPRAQDEASGPPSFVMIEVRLCPRCRASPRPGGPRA